jgi:uncharacterized membrane protein YhhN
LKPTKSATLLWAASILCAVLYGAWLVHWPPSLARTLVKTAATALLAVLAARSSQPRALTAALLLSAAGDAFLAAEPRHGLPPGIGCFLAAHLAYVVLYVGEGGGRPRGAGLAVAVSACVLAAALFVWLLPRPGALTPAVAAYVLALCAMVTTSLSLPPALRLASAGALAFMASDALLASGLFRGFSLAGPHWLTGTTVWSLYYAGQVLIARTFLSRS